MERDTPAVRAGKNAQAAVLHGGIRQVVHEKDLRRNLTRAALLMPSPPVLMPVERRGMGRLAEQKGAPPFRRVKAKRGQGRQRLRPSKQAGKLRMLVGDEDIAA